jgi:T4 bacteriophage base plate protein
MELPRIARPQYTVTLPSNQQECTVMPFTVGHEKLLMIALESNDANMIISTVKQVISECLVKGDVNIDKLPFFDIDYLYYFLHAKSVGDSVEINLTCNATNEEGEVCGHKFKDKISISNYELVKNETISNDISLGDGNGVIMKYPTYTAMKRIDTNANLDFKIATIVNSISIIYDKKKQYPAKDLTPDQMKTFVESLTEENFKKMERFVDNFPTVVVKLDTTCPKCGFKHELRYADFIDFFI